MAERALSRLLLRIPGAAALELIEKVANAPPRARVLSCLRIAGMFIDGLAGIEKAVVTSPAATVGSRANG